MNGINIIDVKAGIEAENDIYAAQVRDLRRRSGVYLVNLMGSPGAGKTTFLERTVDLLKGEFRIGIIEADVDASVDAETMAAHEVKVIQLHTGGSCHMDARMTLEGLRALGEDALDLVFLENIGNLVCPAEFDVGADLKAMILSAPEGDDKPLKYPLMFEVSDCLIVNKMDTAEVFDFDLNRCRERVEALHPEIPVFAVTAKSGEGIAEWAEWLRHEMRPGEKHEND